MTKRSNLTLIIRAFVNEDGRYYGVVSDPGEADGWQATYSELGELINLIDSRLNTRLRIEEDARADSTPDPNKNTCHNSDTGTSNKPTD